MEHLKFLVVRVQCGVSVMVSALCSHLRCVTGSILTCVKNFH